MIEPRYIKKDINELDLDQLRSYKGELTIVYKEIQAQLAAAEQESADKNVEVQALHDYNAMKDLTQTVIGYFANVEGVTILELHQRFNLPLED